MPDSYDRLDLAAGMQLFREGDTGSVAYLIEKGTLDIYVTREGRDVPIVRRGRGEIVGEMAIIDGGPRSASARVFEDCELLVITEGQLGRRLEAADPILRMCVGVVIDRCRETLRLVRGGEAPIASHVTAAQSRDFRAALDELAMERELRRALGEGELALFFQPIIHLATGHLAGFEALARWHHPVRGLTLPGAFIPTAEASGLIVELTEWCLREVAAVYPEIALAALANVRAVDPPFVSVNVTGRDLAQPAFAETVGTILRTAGVHASNLKLEVTESMVMQDLERAGAALRACRDQGVGIAIDDFGTGYSSLSTLGTLPITTLKVDRAFVRSMSAEKTSRMIVVMILRLASELGIPVVAEGIEEATEADTLAGMNCLYGQGFFFGRPEPLDRTLDVIRTWHPPPRRVVPPLRAIG